MPVAGPRTSWIMRSAGDRARYAVFAIAVFLIIGASLLANQALRALIEAGDALDRAQSIMILADHLPLDLRRCELAARNYARDGEARNLDLYRATSAAIPAELAQLRLLTADHPEQQRRIEEIEPLVRESLALIAAFSEASTPEFFSTPLFSAQIRRREALADAIGNTIGELIDEESNLYRGRRATATDNARSTQFAVTGGIGISALALCAVLYFMTVEIRRRRVAEGDLAGVNLRLEDRVRAQTADLTGAIETLRRETEVRRSAEQRLRELRRELVRASRLTAMGQIGAMLAHEINQPLTAIMNYLHGARGMLAPERADAAARVPEMLQKAEQQAIRAAQVVQRLRDYIGSRKTHQAPESLPEMIEDARTLVMAATLPDKVSVRINLDPAARTVVVDRAQIMQVLVNLMRNSIEAMAASDRRELIVSTALRAAGVVEIAVADSGPGLSEEIRRQLFTPFVTTKPDGLGIGLSVCQSIVEAHGGKINAETRPEGGTIFHFTLQGDSPRTPLSAPQDEEERAARPGSAA